MAYSTGSATDWDDFIGKLSSFVTDNGWINETAGDSGTPAADTQCYSKNNVVVAFSWASTPNNIAVYQSLAYVDGAEPNLFTDDSGNGTASPHNDSYIDNERHIDDVGDGPFPSYHFFENDASPAYVHIVLQISTGIYRHFGFGELDKFGDWDTASGGEYVYGHYMGSTSGISTSVTMLLDGGTGGSNPYSIRQYAATMHMEGWVNQPAGGKWALVWGITLAIDEASDIADDTAGVERISVVGGYRANTAAPAFGWQSAGTTSGLIPMYPIMCLYYDWNTKFVYVIGWQKDVRGVNIENFAPGDSISIAGDDWTMFPSVQKGESGTTYFQGIAYKKVTA